MPRTALVTGASAGLGAEFARQLAARGLDLLLVARREDRLKELAAQLEAEHGVQVAIFGADLSQRDAPAEIEAHSREQGIAIDYLINNAGRALPRDELLNKVWGYDYFGTARTIDNFITKLRGKLEADPQKPKRIVSLRGLGYKFVKDEEELPETSE